ncbi:hypothetical protein [Thalassospira xiamenensis]|uniref:hypothetical protein n=1 Tax=Thalassospira xiamenensis TaxID=220697 RepID=UPI000DED60FD|nr:hypothetical protein [Thalassospira xiamenensis]RCK37284.1 hypothetical protein TH24_17070 [Thalassospira xiamenensis]
MMSAKTTPGQNLLPLEAGLPARIEAARLHKGYSVSSLSDAIRQQGHRMLSRHRLAALIRGKGTFSLADAIGLGRVLFDDELALFRPAD